jgi:hypothetical protein
MRPYRRYGVRRWLRIAVAAAVGLLLATALGLVVEVATGPHPKPDYSLPPVPTPPWASPAPPSPTASPTEPALTGPLQLIQGRELINGAYLGYPHSTQGAVSAADQFATQLGSTLDPDRVAAVMRMIADPSYPQAPQQFAQGMITTRKDLGAPASGPVPDGVSVVLEPVEYQVRDVTPDQVTVLLLSDFVITQPAQGTQTRVGVYPLRMHWAQGDWKILAPDNASYTTLSAEPGSPQAASDGWQELSP